MAGQLLHTVRCSEGQDSNRTQTEELNMAAKKSLKKGKKLASAKTLQKFLTLRKK